MFKLYSSGALIDAEITDLLIEELFFERMSSSSSSSSLDDSSSSEDEVKTPRKKRYKRSYVTLSNYTEYEFLEHFKISKRVANHLIQQLEENFVLPTHKSGPEKISSERALLLTLWYLTNQDSFRLVSQKFSVSLSTAHRILSRVINFLITLRDKYICWPSEEESREISNEIKENYKLDGVIGMVDRCHVRIKKPSNSGREYRNKWGNYSILLQVVADSNHLLRDVYCGEPGGLTKWKLLQRSSLFVNNSDYFAFDYCLIGSASYPSGLQWLVTPFTGDVTEEQATFNYQHVKCQSNIKETFAMLKHRFKRLQNFDNLDVQFIINSIMATCILHNICMLEKDDYFNIHEVYLEKEQHDDDDYDSDMENYETMHDRRLEIFNKMFNL